MDSNKIKILASVGVGLMLLVVACLFASAARNAWGSASDIIPFSELSEEEQTALCEALELTLYEEEESIANLTRLVHPGKDGFVEYRLSINTTGKYPFFVRNPYIEKHFTEYAPAEQTIAAVKRGYYFRDKKIYICARYSGKLPFTAVADEIFAARTNASATVDAE
ncbi:MAG: hypothetical protein ACI4Q4_10130 [Oscillospiraceae bacterium]